jgi:hypothetical protein
VGVKFHLSGGKLGGEEEEEEGIYLSVPSFFSLPKLADKLASKQ